jgi:TPR repeat protein
MKFFIQIILAMYLFLNLQNIFAEQCPKDDENRTAEIIDGVIKLDLKLTKECAEKGNIRAQKDLGIAYASGRFGIAQDLDEALKWEIKAALQGDPEAQYDVGLSYSVRDDYKKAMEWYLKASEQNYAEAQLHIGMLYAYGNGVPRDVDKAIYWYRKAATNGNISAQMVIANIDEK